jgi:hypothetical protein
MRRLVYTVTTGDFHREQALVTHPLIRSYAHGHGADFVVIDESRRKFNQHHISYEDFQIPQWLENYDEIVHLDTDVLVMPGTPWLLDISGGMMCATDEQGLYYNNSITLGFMSDYCHDLSLPTTTDDGIQLFNWRYFNFGVFGVTKRDAQFYSDFLAEGQFWSKDKLGIQTPINYRAVVRSHPIRDLGSEFNTLHWTKMRSNAYKTAHIFHYGGTERNHQSLQVYFDLSILKSFGRL